MFSKTHTRNVSRTDYSPISFFFRFVGNATENSTHKISDAPVSTQIFGQPVRPVKHPEFRTSPPCRDGNMHVNVVLWLTTVPYSLRLRVRDMMMSHSLILSSAFPL